MTIHQDPKTQKWISDTVGALSDPLICWPGYEDYKPPAPYMETITVQRLVETMAAIRENRDPLATDGETAWYISTTTLDHMISSEWVQVYMYCFTKTMELMKREVPADLRVDELDHYHMNQFLLPLKRWLYDQRSSPRLGRDKEERKEKREQAKQKKKDLQENMFDLG